MYTAREVTRLGKDLVKTKELNDESITKTITSLKTFKGECEKHKVQEIFAVGTSALRDARNSDIFLREVTEQTDIDIRIISGEKEAELTLKGVLGNEDSGLSATDRPLFIVDIGGGSTEWIFSCYPATPKSTDCPSKIIMDSIQLGAVRLLEKFIHHDPPLSEEIVQIKSAIFESLSKSFATHHMNTSSGIPKAKGLIATGGTATTIAAIDLGLETYASEIIHMHRISRPALQAIYFQLNVPMDQRSKIKGLDPGRADIILPGLLILLGMMDILESDEVTISDYGLLEGLLFADVSKR